MELFINDRSIHEQFTSVNSFLDAFEKLVAMRETARKFDLKIYRHRKFLETWVSPDMSIQQAINNFPIDKKRHAQVWLTNQPNSYWDESTQHRPDDFLVCDGEVVTDSAIGEAAYRSLQDDIRCDLLSFMSHKWNTLSVRVEWHQSEDEYSDIRSIDIKNWWDHNELENQLRQHSLSDVKSWVDLEDELRRQCDNLEFLDGCFNPLRRVPFQRDLINGLRRHFSALNRYAGAFSVGKKRTSECEELHQTYFVGRKAWFSDASDGEEIRFKNEMTFRHPESGDDFFCPWHGKPGKGKDPIRFHFSWPTRTNEPFYIVYVGPKLTKR